MSDIVRLDQAIQSSLQPLDDTDPSKFIVAARMLAFNHTISEIASAIAVDPEDIRNLLAMSNLFRELVDRFHDAWVREQMVDVRRLIEEAEGEVSVGTARYLDKVLQMFRESRVEQREEKRHARDVQHRIETNKSAPIEIELEVIDSE